MKFLLPAVAALLVQQADEAAQLFRKFEKALKESKSFELGFSSSFTKGGETEELNGTIRLQDQDKARIQASGKVDGKEFSVLIVSDGHTLRMSTTLRPNVGAMVTPQGMNDDLLLRFARTSAAKAVLGLHDKLLRLDGERAGARSPEPALAHAPPGIGHFEMGPAEVVENSTKDQVQFVTNDPVSGERTTISLWLDRKDLAPAKRKIDPLKEGGARGTESYSKSAYDGEIAPDTFKWPK